MVTRRDFLGWMTVFAAMGLLHPAQAASRSGKSEYLIIGDGQHGGETLGGTSPYHSRPGAVKIFQSASGAVSQIPLPFFPHAFVQSTGQPGRMITFEKWGRHMAEIDLIEQRVVRVTEARAGRRFFGHGAHSGKYIYASQMNDDKGQGLLAVLDSTSHELLHEIPTRGAFPHDCQWLPDGKTLLLVNSRSHVHAEPRRTNFSSLVWLDALSGNLVKQHHVEQRKFGYAHFAPAADGHVVLGGSYDSRRGSQPLLAVMDPHGRAHALDVKRAAGHALRGEVLSLYLEEAQGRVLATFPSAATVQEWDFRSGRCISQARVEQPRGMVYSDKLNALLVSSARSKGLLALDTAGNVTPVLASGMGTGSHLYCMNW